MDAPTDWVSNVVIATKPPGDLRICIDPKELNKVLKRTDYLVCLMYMMTWLYMGLVTLMNRLMRITTET